MVVVPAVLLELEMEDVLSWLLVMISTDVAPVEELEMRLSTRSSVVDVASIMELVGIVSASVVELGIVSASVVELESMLVDSSMEVVIAENVTNQDLFSTKPGSRFFPLRSTKPGSILF